MHEANRALLELLGEIILMFSLILQFISLVSRASKMFSRQQIFVQECCVNSERLWISTNWLMSLGHVKTEGRACHTLEKEVSPSVALHTSQAGTFCCEDAGHKDWGCGSEAELFLSNGKEAMDSVSEPGERRVLLGAS